MTRRTPKPDREGLPLSHYAARRSAPNIVRNGITVDVHAGEDPEDFLSLMQASPGYFVLVPAFNGSLEWDEKALHAVLSVPTLLAIVDVHRAGGERLMPSRIAKITHAVGGNVAAVLAFFGILHDRHGNPVGFDTPTVVPLDVTNSELLAIYLFNMRHFADARVTGIVRRRDAAGPRSGEPVKP